MFRKIHDDNDFQYWLFEMSENLEKLRDLLPNDIEKTVDYSIESLSSLESWVIKYAFPQVSESWLVKALVLEGDLYFELELVSIYIGEVIRKNIGGRWVADISNPNSFYYRVPVIESDTYGSICPVELVISALKKKKTSSIYDKVNKMANSQSSI